MEVYTAAFVLCKASASRGDMNDAIIDDTTIINAV